MDYVCFKNYYDIIAIDLSKQQALDATPKAIQQINFFLEIYINQKELQYFSLSEKPKKKKKIF